MHNNLFTEFDSFMLKTFDRLYPVLAELIPMKPNQRKELPYACKELSEYLTTDREFLSRPYWTSPRLLSAYFHYFMVWNLIRLCKLFPSLNLENIPQKAVFMDLGSGPLTIPLALWISREDLRKKDITFICADIAPQPLAIGKHLFEKLRQELMPECTWKIRTLRAPNHKAFRQIHEPISLLTMGNVLNEGDEKKDFSTFEQIQQIYNNACKILTNDGKIFAVEPGTRQGARMIQILRNLVTKEITEENDFEDTLFENNNEITKNSIDNENYLLTNCYDTNFEAPCKIISPCPLQISCPLAKQNHNHNAWCHFNIKTDFVPKELREISQRAGLDKDSVSLSYLFLAKNSEANHIHKNETSQNKARIISDAFPIPQYQGKARYACHEKGLLLVLDAVSIPAGSLCEISFPSKNVRDLKSKALLCTLKNRKTVRELEIQEPIENTAKRKCTIKENSTQKNNLFKTQNYSKNTPKQNNEGKKSSKNRKKLYNPKQQSKKKTYAK